MSDYLIVGGGIIGLLTAWELSQAGATVTLLEKGRTGREASWAGGGILSPLYPWRYPASVTALASWSQRRFPELAERLQSTTGVDPQYTRSGLMILDTEEQQQALDWAQAYDNRIEVIEEAAIQELEPGLGQVPAQALWLPQIAQIRNPRLARAARLAIEPQVEVREEERVLGPLVDRGRVTGVKTGKGLVHAGQVVICTGAWTGELLASMHRPPAIEPVRGQMILFYAKPGQIKRIVLRDRRYVIPRRDGRVLVGSTIEYTGFEKATTAEAKEELYRQATAMFPFLKTAPIENQWAGLRPGAPAGVPYIGAYPGIDGLYINAGHYRNGVALSPASARLMADLLLDRKPILPPEPYALEASRTESGGS